VSHSRSEAPVGNSLLTQDFFSLFGLPRSYDLALDQLESAWKRLQAVVHPDRFAGAGDAQRRMALQWSTRINEGHQTLKHPISRATYLLALNGVDLQAESNTSMPAEFLMTQMAWREALDELREQSDAQRRAEDKASLRQQVDQFWQSGEARLVGLLSGAAHTQALAEAADLVRQLMFVKKFEQELLEA
jgi:molecular chaperone HscB